MPSLTAASSCAIRSACVTRGIQETVRMSAWSVKRNSLKARNSLRVTALSDWNRARTAATLEICSLIPVCRIMARLCARALNSCSASRLSQTETVSPAATDTANPMTAVAMLAQTYGPEGHLARSSRALPAGPGMFQHGLARRTRTPVLQTAGSSFACFKCTSRGCRYREARAGIHLKEAEFAAVAASRFHRRLNTRRNIGTAPKRVLDQRSAQHSFMVGKMQMKWGQFSEIYTERSGVGRANVCASFWSREITRIRPRTEHRVTTRGRCLA